MPKTDSLDFFFELAVMVVSGLLLALFVDSWLGGKLTHWLAQRI